MSDERDVAGSPVEDADDDDEPTAAADHGQTAVVARPQRPTGKRPRRALTVEDADPDTESKSTKNGDGKKPKKSKADKSGPSRNPVTFVLTYLQQVVAELRKVIWPNRKQMVTYTSVVLVFLAFMVALIGGVDYGLGRLVSMVFG